MRYVDGTRVHKKPPSTWRRLPPWRVALVANIKDDFERSVHDPQDAGAEFDRRSTLEAIGAALEYEGHWVHVCQADDTLPEVLMNLRPHLVFNIAEGMGGDAREAQVPALCEMLGIPYTASRVLANALSLDKTQTKRIWRDNGLPTAAFQGFASEFEALEPGLQFPLFVKPAREGTGMGVDGAAIVHNAQELKARVAWVLRTYRQPALVEEMLPGREFTVGYIGNRGDSAHRARPWLYDSDGYHFFPVLEIDNAISISPGIYGYDAKSYDIGVDGAPGYLCPAQIPNELRLKLIDLTRRAAEALGACDVSRVDLRLGSDGEPYLMEINTLPGLNPLVSDLCIMAASEGMAYPVLISEIAYLAAERFGMPFEGKALGAMIESRSLVGMLAGSPGDWG
jgi:D-alanine-D-alanine ligase